MRRTGDVGQWLRTHQWVAGVVALVLLAGVTAGVARLSRSTESRLVWTPVSAAGIPTGVTLASLSCPEPDDCWTAGTAADEAGFLAHLHNGAWTVVRDNSVPNLDRATDVACRAADDCWASGGAGVWHYDGTQWTVREPEFDADHRPLVPAGDMSCQPGGTCVATAVGAPDCQTGASVWDGKAWHPTPVAGTAPCLRTVSCPEVDRCTGFGLTGDDQPAPVLFRVDGDGWRTTVETTRRTYLRTAAVSTCPAVDRCAVLYSAALNRYRPWAEVGLLDGDAWRDPASANAGLPESLYATGLACPSLTQCLLVGADTTVTSGTFHATTYQWDGTQWTMSEPGPFGDGSILNAVACAAANDCWAIGVDDGGGSILLRATAG
jgi:hypothetical protein